MLVTLNIIQKIEGYISYQIGCYWACCSSPKSYYRYGWGHIARCIASAMLNCDAAWIFLNVSHEVFWDPKFSPAPPLLLLVIFLSNFQGGLFSTLCDLEVSLISPVLVPVIFLIPSLGILWGNSLGAPLDAVKRTFFVPEELLMMSFCILEAAWRKPVQKLLLFLRMLWGGSCATWELGNWK